MKKLTYEYVKSYIESEGYILLSDTYNGNHSKLLIRCPEGHEYSVMFYSFKSGQRCKICRRAEVSKNMLFTYDYVQSYINLTGYKLLSDEYINGKTKLLVRCPEGHEYNVRFIQFKSGQRCPICSDNNKRLTYGHVKSYIESFNYTLLSDTYKDNHSKLLVRCPEGHEYNVMFYSFKSGQRCPICSDNNKRLAYEYVKNYIHSTGYTILSDTYRNNYTKISIKCDKGHEYSVNFNNFRLGRRCPICNNSKTSSKGEMEVCGFVKSIVGGVLSNDRTQITNPITGHNLELDIWIPSMGKAIEYNGWYHFYYDDRDCRDKIKQEQCKQLGIDLLIVKEHNWINNNEFEREIIRRFING